jgi:hypothetical protein
MRATRTLVSCLLALLLLGWPFPSPRAAVPNDSDLEVAIAEDEVLFEFVGQVKNSPPALPGLPATSVQYGYLSFLRSLDQVFTSDVPAQQNEKTALFTFFNEAVTQRVVLHGNLRVVTRVGTSTIYFNQTPSGDLTTPNPDSFRSGQPILRSSWRHQVALDSLSGLFFVHFENTVTSTDSFEFQGREVRIGKVGDQYRMSLIGDADLSGKVDGKFTGFAIGLKSKHDLRED